MPSNPRGGTFTICNMARRPSLIDRLVAKAASAHARSIYNRFQAATRQAASVQEQALLAKIRRNADSDFGREHGFDRIASAADFRKRMPLSRYEDVRPYVHRVMAGDTRALFGGRQRVIMFALTSGSTAEPKHIPITSHFLEEYRRGWNAFGIKVYLDHPEALLRNILQVTSRMDESCTSAGIPCGAISGLMSATQKRLVRKYYLNPLDTAHILDSTAKYYTIMRLAVPNDVAFMITASPATQLRLARVANAHHARLIRDVHDGTLAADLPIPDFVRERLRPRLRPDPQAARRLEELVATHGRLLPKHYWNLSVVANWTGGTMGLHLDSFEEYFGAVPVRDIGLLATEGRVSIPIEDGTPAGILDVCSNYFEFIPQDRIDEACPPTFGCHELEVGQDYFIVLTTSAGLYRYDLRDLVRVVGYVNEAPVIEFLNKGAHISSLTGEKLTEHQVIEAMGEVGRSHGSAIVNFVLAPRWDQTPYYVLHVERSDLAQTDGHLAHALDLALQQVNIEYASKRQSDRLGPVRTNVLPSGYLSSRDEREAVRYRPANEQYKHRYLYTQPDHDGELLSIGKLVGEAKNPEPQ